MLPSIHSWENAPDGDPKMAYLSTPFEHDIFVSYAHGVADRRGVKRLKDWSERLNDELESEIKNWQLEFDDLNIFIDRDLDPTRPLTDLLRGHVASSGLLLVIMSERYLSSAWCTDEREWFEAEVKRRGVSGGVVLVVRAQPTNHELWPACLKDERGHVVLGFQFHPNPKRRRACSALWLARTLAPGPRLLRRAQQARDHRDATTAPAEAGAGARGRSAPAPGARSGSRASRTSTCKPRSRPLRPGRKPKRCWRAPLPGPARGAAVGRPRS